MEFEPTDYGYDDEDYGYDEDTEEPTENDTEETKENIYIYYTTLDKITLYDTEGDVNDIYFKDRDEKYQHLFLSSDVSSDSKYVIAGSEHGTVRLWSIPNKTLLADIKIHSKSILSCCFSPDNKYLLTGSTDNIIRLWKVDHDKHKLKVLSAVNIKKISGDNTHEFMSCDFSPDGSFILINSYNSVLFVISIRDFEDNNLHNKIVISLHKPTYTYCMSPDNKYICLGIDNSLFMYTNTLLGLGRNILELKQPPEYKVNFCKISGDGLILCSTYSNGKIVLLKGNEKEEIDVSPLSCGEFSFSRDNKHLVVICGLSTIKIFDIATRSELYEITTRDTIEHCGFLKGFSEKNRGKPIEPIQPVLDEIIELPEGKFIGIEPFIEGVEPDYRCTFPAMKIIPFLIRVSKEFLSGVLCNVRSGIQKKKKFNSTIHVNYNNNIYNPPNVTFPNNLLENIKECNENLIVLFLSLDNVENNIGHANMLIIDKETNTVERFEPNGIFMNKYTDIHLNNIIENYFSEYELIPSLDICLNTSIKDKYCRLVDEGLCVVYSTMYAFLKLINHSYFRGNPMSQMFIKDYIVKLNSEDVHKFMGYINKYISDKEANAFFMSEDVYNV